MEGKVSTSLERLVMAAVATGAFGVASVLLSDEAGDFAYGEKLAARGYFDLGAIVYEDALRAHPRVADREHVLLRIAELHAKQGNARRSRYWLERVLDEFPATRRRTEIMLKMAGTYRAEGRHEAALQLLDRCIEEAGGKSAVLESALLERGECLLQLGRPRKAAEALRSFIERFPGSTHAATGYLKLGEAELGAGELERAIAGFSKAQEMAQDARIQVEALYGLGRTYMKQGDLVRAAATLSKLTTDETSSQYAPRAMLALAEIQRNWRNPEKALSILLDVVRRFPKSDSASGALVEIGTALRKKIANGIMSPSELAEDELFALAEADRAQRRCKEAAERYDRYISKFPRGRYADMAQFRMGECYKALGRWDEAAESYEAVTQFYANSPLAPEALFQAGKAYESAHKPAEMAHVFSRLYRTYPAFRKIDTVLLSLGDALFAAKRFDEAAQMYRAIHTRFPRSAHYEDALYRLGHALYCAKEYPAAAESFEEFARRFGHNPNAARAAYMAGECLVQATWFRQAESALTEYVQRFPRDDSVPKAYFQLGVIHEAWKNLDEARKYYARTIKADATDPLAGDALHRTAIILYQQGKLPEARKAFVQIIKQWPNKVLPVQTYEWLEAQFEKTGQQNLAVRVCQLLIEHYQDEPKARPAVEAAYDRMAMVRFRSKAWTQARQAWEEMLRAFPNSERRLDVKLRIAECYEKVGQFDEAILTLREIERSPSVERQAQAKHEIGRCYMLKGEREKAAKHFRDVVDRFGSAAVCADWVLRSALALAQSYEDQGDTRRARRAYDRARRIVPNSHDLLALIERAERGYRRTGGR